MVPSCNCSSVTRCVASQTLAVALMRFYSRFHKFMFTVSITTSMSICIDLLHAVGVSYKAANEGKKGIGE